MSGEPKLKGSVLREQLNYIESEYGQAAVDEALSTVSPQVRKEIQDFLPISWVSVASAKAFKDAVASQVGMDSLVFNQHVVRASLGTTIHSLWRVLLRQLKDGTIIKRTPMIYGMTFDKGKMSLLSAQEHEATFELIGWPTIPEYDCAGLAAGIEAVLEFSGRGATSTTWKRSGTTVFFTATWAP